jgi:tRNA(adenine34) deaminase
VEDHERFMRLALEEAQRARVEGNMAVGSVIVREGRIVARGRNEANSRLDITAHAETVALRAMSSDVGFFNPTLRRDYFPLAGHVLYTTVEPCGMCAWAIGMTGVSTVVIGARLADFGVHYGDYTFERFMTMIGRSPTVLSSLVDESVRLVLTQQREIAGGPPNSTRSGEQP